MPLEPGAKLFFVVKKIKTGGCQGKKKSVLKTLGKMMCGRRDIRVPKSKYFGGGVFFMEGVFVFGNFVV